MVLLRRRRYVKGSRKKLGPRRKIVCLVRDMTEEWSKPLPPVPAVFEQALEEATRRLEAP